MEKQMRSEVRRVEGERWSRSISARPERASERLLLLLAL